MKKFLIITIVIIAGVVAWVLFSNAVPREEAGKNVTIGVFYKGNNFKKVADGFIENFNKNLPAGYIVDYIIVDEPGSEQKDFDITAQRMVLKNVDLIVAIGIEPVLAAKKATTEHNIPVVSELGVNPVTLGVVANFQRPGGNITGVTWQVEELSGKRLEFLKKVDPRVKRITIFRKKGSTAMDVPLKYMNPVAKNLGVAITVRDVANVDELREAVRTISARDTDALFYSPDPFVSRNIDILIARAIDQKIPTMFHDENWVKSGGLASYGGNFYDAGLQGARLAAKILFEGGNPADIPIETVSKIDFALNLATAEKIGLLIPSGVLSLAQSVVR